MAGLEREEFRVLYLNNQNQLIAVKPSSPAPSTARKSIPGK
ncbi:putative CP4-6 prophage protein DNA repair protein [Escherichia coli DEC8D]|nr:putative CP4-6 prophage protein DNA repair protein [Escherichia coli DEC8D]